nr:Orf+3 [Streptomyces sp.]
MPQRVSPLLRRPVLLAGAACGVAGALTVGLLLYRSSSEDTSQPSAHTTDAPSPVVPPAANAPFDYQIGGPYQPAEKIRAVSRDRAAEPVRGLYNICYVNAFQAQPDELPWWRSNHPDLLLKDAAGRPVIDKDWNEVLLDTSTADKRERLAVIVGRWIKGCAASGFQAVEPDNLDSYDRSQGLLRQSDNAAFARLLARRSHAAGLAIGQKNTAELLDRRTAIGFDFAVAEECGRYDECGAFAKAYHDRVFVIEYRDADFAKSCRIWGSHLSIVRRDVDVMSKGAAGYRFTDC